MTRLMKDDTPNRSHWGKVSSSTNKLVKPPPVNAPVIVPPPTGGPAGPDATTVSK